MIREEALFGVELRHLSALAAVARERSFRGAADSLGYVQSAVSQQVADLERLVGVRLVERSRGRQKVSLTEPGELLVAHAEEILARLGAAHADLVSHSQAGQQETLTVGIFQSVATGFLPRVMRRLALAAPDLRVVPVETSRDMALFDLVERGSVDVAFADLPLRSGPFESCTILRDPCALVVASDSEWAERTSRPTLQELAGLRLVAPEGCRFVSSLRAWFALHGVELDFAVRVEHEATARALVASGAVSEIVSWLAVDTHNPDTVVIDLTGIVPSRKLGMYWQGGRRERTALEMFRRVAASTALDLSDERPGSQDPPVALAAA
jgi:DNA-binding transcriptional LysR family regulator